MTAHTRVLPLILLLACAPSAPPASSSAEAPAPSSAPSVGADLPSTAASNATAASASPSASSPTPPSPAQPPARDEIVDLSRFFAPAKLTGSFLVHQPRTGRTLRYNPERLRTRFTPASTFKIPNSLIAVETGVASGPEFAIAWDSTKAPKEAWWPEAWTRKEHTLESAFRNSVVWYYQEIARRIGPERMQTYLRQFDYGNQDTTPRIDTFWLSGGLRISPEEEVRFLQRFHEGKLGVSARATAAVKQILVLEDSSAYRLSGKTGTSAEDPARELGWLVGYVERGDDVAYYALNMEGPGIWKNFSPQKRVSLAREILQSLGFIPEGAAPPPAKAP
ncbi:penicillin-binding transpeptidase domain-containing protein [Chondromyces apiculatus]|uniref:Beta-lactamase n=1 Tax=Chondromyces apiculatus DSM 436 TaxID=1192034 RepID=A0A017THT0_9BACT|nr:penicillin-binding transpeptidase domain-containing protein [Chondromyces apiculatus]EYF08395.1 Beta-lactamase [Chondromyces apiculatus DSM 436]